MSALDLHTGMYLEAGKLRSSMLCELKIVCVVLMEMGEPDLFFLGTETQSRMEFVFEWLGRSLGANKEHSDAVVSLLSMAPAMARVLVHLI